MQTDNIMGFPVRIDSNVPENTIRLITVDMDELANYLRTHRLETHTEPTEDGIRFVAQYVAAKRMAKE